MSDLIEKYRFSSADSKAAAVAAIECVKQGQPGAFLVCGPSGSGKTSFVRECLSLRFENPAVCALPSRVDEVALGRCLFSLIPSGYVWFDNCSQRFLSTPTLLCFLVSSVWIVRPFRKITIESRENKCVVFLIANDPQIDGDLARRVRVIELVEGGAL